MTQTQINWTKNEVDTHGEVSRNKALNNFISRLGAIVPLLNKIGYNLKGRYVDTEHGKDYIYYNYKPKQKQLW